MGHDGWRPGLCRGPDQTGTNRTGRRDPVGALRDLGAGLVGSGGGRPGRPYTVLGPLRAARRYSKADARSADGARLRGILVGIRGWAELRLRAAQRPEFS